MIHHALNGFIARLNSKVHEALNDLVYGAKMRIHQLGMAAKAKDHSCRLRTS